MASDDEAGESGPPKKLRQDVQFEKTSGDPGEAMEVTAPLPDFSRGTPVMSSPGPGGDAEMLSPTPQRSESSRENASCVNCSRPCSSKRKLEFDEPDARPGTSADFTPGGCDCSSELVATMVLQRHHAETNCPICTNTNRDFQSPIPTTSEPHEISKKEPSFKTNSENVTFCPKCESQRKSSKFHINELPVPIILKMFGFLTRYDQLLRAGLVCKLWYGLIRDPELWRVIDVRGLFKVSNRVLERLTSYSDHVTSVDLSDAKLITSTGILSLTQRCTSLRVLKLSRCYNLNTLAFQSIGEHCHQLRRLYLDICFTLTDQALASIVCGCHRLTHLSLNHCDSITDNGIRAVAENCPQLEMINLDHLGKLSHECLYELSIGCPKLVHVSLMSAVMTDKGILHLTKLKNLQVLDVSNITLLTRRSVTRIVTDCKVLMKLNICLMRWVDDVMIETIAKNAKNLRTLHCVSCNITDNGLKILAENSKTLEVLDVSWCNEVTAEGVEYISKNCPTLRFISLIRCDRVTMETLTEFVERYPRIHYSSFFLDAQRLLKKAMREGYI